VGVVGCGEVAQIVHVCRPHFSRDGRSDQYDGTDTDTSIAMGETDR
jgi:hypothetical protein